MYWEGKYCMSGIKEHSSDLIKHSKNKIILQKTYANILKILDKDFYEIQHKRKRKSEIEIIT